MVLNVAFLILGHAPFQDSILTDHWQTLVSKHYGYDLQGQSDRLTSALSTNQHRVCSLAPNHRRSQSEGKKKVTGSNSCTIYILDTLLIELRGVSLIQFYSNTFHLDVGFSNSLRSGLILNLAQIWGPHNLTGAIKPLTLKENGPKHTHNSSLN